MIKKLLLSACIAMALSSCSSTSIVTKSSLRDNPKIKSTNLSNSLQCIKKGIKSSKDSTLGYLFTVPKIIDGTVYEGFDGELSDSLQYELIANLHNTLPKGYGLVLTNHPIIFRETEGGSDFGLNQYGVVSGDTLETITKVYLSHINKKRKRAQKAFPNEKISLYSTLEPRIIKAAFTRNDKEPIHKKGFGFNIGSDGNDGDGSIDVGKTNEYSSISLTILLNNPSSNTLQDAATFTLNVYRKTNNFELSLGPGEGFLGLVNEDLVIESKHGAQQALIDAATIWVLDKTYGDRADFSRCKYETSQ